MSATHTPTHRTAHLRSTVLCVLLGLNTLATQAQTSPPAAPAASAALNKKIPAPHTPAEVRESATTPGDLRPENPVVPQISIPLGRGERAPAWSRDEQMRKARRAQQAAAGDTAASCLAKVRAEERQACMNRVHRASGQPKTP